MPEMPCEWCGLAHLTSDCTALRQHVADQRYAAAAAEMIAARGRASLEARLREIDRELAVLREERGRVMDLLAAS